MRGLVPFGISNLGLWDEDDFFGTRKLFNEIGNMSLRSLKSDIKETDTSYTVEAELPGFDKKDIDVSLENGVLTIKAEVKKETEDKEKKDGYIRKERYSGSYVRSYTFDDIDEEKVNAKYENGILKVELPKVEKEVNKKGIEIQ